jgi:kanamycin kinase
MGTATVHGLDIPASLAPPPPIDRLVVCHGDTCAPNTLIDDDGRFSANVDFGRLGAADRWADLAVATMSIGWNCGNVDEQLLWDAYGIEPDKDRIEYYRALWNAT